MESHKNHYTHQTLRSRCENGIERHVYLVANVERRIEDHVPHNGRHIQLRRVLQRRQYGFAEQAVGHHAAGKDDQHRRQPTGERVLARERLRSGSQVLANGQRAQQTVEARANESKNEFTICID